MVHFNWIQLAPGVNHDNLHIATLAATSGLLILLGLFARLALGSGETAMLPVKKFSLRGLFEVLIEFIHGMATEIIGEEGKKFVPYLAILFAFILVNNLLGLLPGMTPATDNINTTFALGLTTFALYNIMGIKEHGIHYVKQFLGPFAKWSGILLLIPALIITVFMLVVESFSHVLRPFSLAVRLYGNMLGDHASLATFTELFPFLVPVAFYFLGLLVCLVQAFVFTLLTMVYISMAMSHDH